MVDLHSLLPCNAQTRREHALTKDTVRFSLRITIISRGLFQSKTHVNAVSNKVGHPARS